MHQTAVNLATNMIVGGSRWVYFEAGHGAYNAPYPSKDTEFKGCRSSKTTALFGLKPCIKYQVYTLLI